MQSGKLNVRIKIQSETITRDQFGGEIISWNTIHEVWAKQKVTTGRKTVEGDMEIAMSKTEFYIRYIPALSTKNRIVVPVKFKGVDYPDLIYKIESIGDTDGKQRELKIVCSIVES